MNNGIVSSKALSAGVLSSKTFSSKAFSSKALGAALAPGMVLASSLCAAGPALGQPSFNCVTNRAPDEVTICNSVALSELDRKLNYLYTATLERLNLSQQEVLRGTQRYWLHLRADCGRSTGCIRSLYRERIRLLNAMLD